ncbi:MAG: hypothetical protein ABSF71_39040 [Terriglobia bacterium]|jgi:hypothetical protein
MSQVGWPNTATLQKEATLGHGEGKGLHPEGTGSDGNLGGAAGATPICCTEVNHHATETDYDHHRCARNSTLDFEGSSGKGCEKAFDDFRARDMVKVEQTKSGYYTGQQAQQEKSQR